jgi:hypothetical protein
MSTTIKSFASNRLLRLFDARQSYTLLSGKEELEELPALEQNRRISRKNLRTGVLVAIIATVIMVFTAASIAWTRQPQWVPCGSTATEARAAGCHYEPMQRSWIPDACYFEEPSSEYDPFNDRQWFSDRNRTIPADLVGLRSGDSELAFTREFLQCQDDT